MTILIMYPPKDLNMYKNDRVFLVALFPVLYIYEKKKILILSRVIVNVFSFSFNSVWAARLAWGFPTYAPGTFVVVDIALSLLIFFYKWNPISF